MQTSAVTGSSAHWPALCITAAFYLTTIPERFGFQRQFFFFSVYNATEHFHQDYEPTTTHTVWIRGGKVLSVSQRVQLSSSACRFQWKVQPHGSTHDTPAQYWRRTMEGGNYACGGGGGNITITPTFVEQIIQPQWCLWLSEFQLLVIQCGN